MRIVGGKHRGRTIKGPPKKQQLNTRPTTDRVRELLFNIIAPRIRGANFLDLFAGTGAVGIEALSRGAESLTLVEKNMAMVRVIKDNLLSLGEEAEVFPVDVYKALEALAKEGRKFEIIFADPPYHLETGQEFFQLVEPVLSEGGLLVLEHSAEQIDQNILLEQKRYVYGETIISLFTRGEHT